MLWLCDNAVAKPAVFGESMNIFKHSRPPLFPFHFTLSRFIRFLSSFFSSLAIFSLPFPFPPFPFSLILSSLPLSSHLLLFLLTVFLSSLSLLILFHLLSYHQSDSFSFPLSLPPFSTPSLLFFLSLPPYPLAFLLFSCPSPRRI